MPARVQVDESAFLYDWEAGMTTAAMGAKYGMSDSTVSKRAKAMGLSGRRTDVAAGLRPITHPHFALVGGAWVPDGGIMRWLPGASA